MKLTRFLLRTLIVSIPVLIGAVQASAQSSFTWQNTSAGTTSAGVYDSTGKLVRTLWAAESFPIGTFTATWDGLDHFGNTVSGACTWKVIRNGSVYTNNSVIGNEGGPPFNTRNSIPFYLEGAAVDAQGYFYTVHGWNETHHNVNKWNPADGSLNLHTGNAVPYPLLHGIAIEPDGSVAYTTGFSDEKDRTLSKFTIWKIDTAPGVHSDDARRLSFTADLPNDINAEGYTGSLNGCYIPVYNGNTGGYPSAGYPTPAFPAGASDSDKEVMNTPLHSIIVTGPDKNSGSIYVTDAVGGRILKYDKVTGLHQQTISGIPLARGLAMDANGNLWVGHEHSKVSVYNSSGGFIATRITDLTEVIALSIRTVQGTQTLCVADSTQQTGKLRKYTVTGTSLSQVGSTFGSQQAAGDWQPDKLREIHGVALDASGNMLVTSRMGMGGRLLKLKPDFTLDWELLSLEFSSSAAFVAENPNTLISASRQIYNVNRADGSWSYLGRGMPETIHSNKAGAYNGQFEASHSGPPQALRFNGKDYFYFAPAYTPDSGMAVYQVVPAVPPRGPTLKLVSMLGRSSPAPDGKEYRELWLQQNIPNRYLWEWKDTNTGGQSGDGQIQYTPRTTPGTGGEVNVVGVGTLPAPAGGDWEWVVRSWCVDESGWLWLANGARRNIPSGYPHEGESIYAVPPQFDGAGNPFYTWTAPVRAMDGDTIRNAIGQGTQGTCEIKMVNRGDNGLVYALVSSQKAGLAVDSGAHMGGNVLFAFQQSDLAVPNSLTLKWAAATPQVNVGLVPITGGAGGAFSGQNKRNDGSIRTGIINHYTRDGLLVGQFINNPIFGAVPDEPGGDLQLPEVWPSGGLDAYLALSGKRNPVDGKIDLFAEDNINHRIIWYRIDDSNITTVASNSISAGGSGTRYTLTVNGGFGDGNYTSGSTVWITASAPPAGKVFTGWVATGGAVVQSPSAISTTVSIPSSAASVTATYGWKTGNDKIRFYTLEPNNLVNSVWEGANDLNGPWTAFYDIAHGSTNPPLPANGWNDVSVDMGSGYRYVRFRTRSYTSGGVVREMEWYRGSTKLSGTAFGTAGTQPTLSFDKAVDGDINTRFDWAPTNTVPGAYVGIDTGVTGTAAAPSFSPAAGSYSSAQTVTISSVTSGATIRYTTDGSMPSQTNGTVGTSAVISSTTTLKAIAYKSGLADSSITSGSYTITLPQVSAPTFTPGEGTYTSAQTVTITSSTSGATIRYTTDGSTPSQSNGTVGTSVAISSTTTLRAIAYKSGMSDSSVSTAVYTINTGVGTGLLGQFYNDPSGGNYPLQNPFTSSPVLTRTDATLDFDWGGNSPGSPVTASYWSAKWTGQLKAPVTGSYNLVLISDDGIKLFLNGTQVITNGWIDQGPTTYTYTTSLTAGVLYNVEVHYYQKGGGSVCRFRWSYPGQTEQVIPVSQLYPSGGGGGTQQVAAPSFSPAPGSYSSAQTVNLTSGTSGATIRYTTDGSTPSQTNGTVGTSVVISATTTLKAIAYKSGMSDSSVTSGTYTISLAQVSAPTFTPAAGTYTSAQNVTISSSTSGATFRYTTDGSTPSQSNGTVGTSVTISSTTTLKAIAYKSGMSDSSVTAAVYTINSGTAGTGLLGQYYNDPSNGSYPLSNPFTTSPVLTRTDATVDFDWGGNSPGSPVTASFWSAKWTGQLKAPVTGSYNLILIADDGIKFFLNGTQVITNGWKDQGPTPYTYTTSLTAGVLYNIEIHYYQKGSGSVCRFHWSYPGQAEQTIPQSQLYPSTGGGGGGTVAGSLTREVWTGINGDNITDIPTGTTPNISDTVTTFEAPQNWGDNYGTRLKGYITAPATGSYTFWMASDNAGELWLSTDSNPANKVKIAWVTTWTDYRSWNQLSTQKSAAINLVQGQTYYVEALQKDGGGGDHLSVGWAKPGESTTAPSGIIPGSVLSH